MIVSLQSMEEETLKLLTDRGLSNKDLDSILKTNEFTKSGFMGTFPACRVRLPTKKRQYSFITNIDHCLRKGKHWNGWYVDDDTIYFFDSFGRGVLDLNFPHYYRDIVLQFKNVKCFEQQLQPFNSKTCGLYCIHFILNFSVGWGFKTFKSDYTLHNTKRNDEIVVEIIESLI